MESPKLYIVLQQRVEVDDAVGMGMDQAATCRRTVTKQTQEEEEQEAM